jgi:7-cyano-7-deazaguanine reductase
MEKLTSSELGKQSTYKSKYDNTILFSIPRKTKRLEINIPNDYHFYGADIWNAYEISWLNENGKPIIVIGTFELDANSINIIESKSFKLYLNSFNNTIFKNKDEVLKVLKKDLFNAAKGNIKVRLYSLNEYNNEYENQFHASSIDHIDIPISEYQPNKDLLKIKSNKIISETISSDLLKSNCLITGQPDWGSIFIDYEGNEIDHNSLLKYIVSFRNHNEFHEQCIERIFMDIMDKCQPNKLLVYGRYTRRGGLDINPIRSTHQYSDKLHTIRLCRQ